MFFILILSAWAVFTGFAFYNTHTKLATTLLILGMVDLFLIFFVGIGIIGIVFLAVLGIIGIIRFKLDSV